MLNSFFHSDYNLDVPSSDDELFENNEEENHELENLTLDHLCGKFVE